MSVRARTPCSATSRTTDDGIVHPRTATSVQTRCCPPIERRTRRYVLRTRVGTYGGSHPSLLDHELIPMSGSREPSLFPSTGVRESYLLVRPVSERRAHDLTRYLFLWPFLYDPCTQSQSDTRVFGDCCPVVRYVHERFGCLRYQVPLRFRLRLLVVRVGQWVPKSFGHVNPSDTARSSFDPLPHSAFVPVMYDDHVVRERRKVQESGTERSEEHTSELQSPCNLVCRLLLE